MAITWSMQAEKTKKANDCIQVREQISSTGQVSSCGSEDKTIVSCNNLAFTANINDGNNAAGKQKN